MNDAFVGWLNKELEQRGWSRSEAARRGSISSSSYYKVITGQADPGLKFCTAVARAFRVPLDEVLLRAGMVPSSRRRVDQVNEFGILYRVEDPAARERTEEMLDVFYRCSQRDQELVLEICQRLAGTTPLIIGEEEHEP